MRKKAIIEEIKSLIGADENINTIYKNFRTLQESWYSTGPVSRSENQNLWETFKHHVERFYDFLHLNRELRELDFKHNYKEKLKISALTAWILRIKLMTKVKEYMTQRPRRWVKKGYGVILNNSRKIWVRF
mgnify:CR=1 FL=1